MFELFGHSFGVFGVLGLTVILYGIVARIVWHVGLSMNKLWYIPWRICVEVHDHLSQWMKKGRDLLNKRPQVTSRGFLLTPIWISVIFLNVFLLAQVLGVILPGGKHITFPWVGTYTTFPLILGILYAVSETVLGVVRNAFKSKILMFLLVLLLLSMFVVEAGLSFYRAWLLTNGEEMISPTMWDKVILRVGPFLAAGIAFAVAAVETLVGYFSFCEFIDKMIPVVLSWFGGIVTWIWCGIAYWLFGFHRIPPPHDPTWRIIPPDLSHIGQRVDVLEARASKLDRDVPELQRKLSDLPPPPKSFIDLRKDWESSLKGIDLDKVKSSLEGKSKLLVEEIENVKKLSKLSPLKNQLKELKRGMDKTVNEIQVKTNHNRDNVRGAHGCFNLRRDAIGSCHNLLESAKSEHKDLSMICYKEDQALLYYNANRVLSLSQDGYDINECERILNTAKTKIEAVEGNLSRIEVDLTGLTIPHAGTFSKEDHDALETEILLFLTHDIPSIKAAILEPNSAYRWKRFHLMLPWNWFSGNGNGDHKSPPPDAPADKQNDVPEREEEDQ
jgi:hypothetical protein